MGSISQQFQQKENQDSEEKEMSDIEFSRTEIQHLIDEWVFDERARQILARRWFDGITYEKLAEEFNLSVRQTKNIVRKSRNEVFKHFPKITL